MDYFDLHCDTPYECYTKNQLFGQNNLAVSAQKGKIFDRWTQTFAVWIRDDAAEPFLLYDRIIKNFKKELEKKPDNLTPLFSVEGGAVIGDNLGLLERLKSDGVRFFTLTWNGENRIAGGSKTSAGLTRFGREVISKLNSLHMSCDLSHLNDKSFSDAVKLADFPVATHSNSRFVCDVPRNLSDSQLKLIAEKGGVIGLCLYPAFLGGDVFLKLYENIIHMLDLGLENNIAIGSDFDGADMDQKLSDISKIPVLYQYLKGKGLSEDLLEKIFYKNAAKYIETFDKREVL